jgi:hypothetical protein
MVGARLALALANYALIASHSNFLAMPYSTCYTDGVSITLPVVGDFI